MHIVYTVLIFILVGEAPEVLHPLEDATIVAPAEAVMECDLAPGEPEAEVRW